MCNDSCHHMILSKYFVPLLHSHAHSGSHPTFRPISIVMIVSRRMQDVLRLVQRATTPRDTAWALEANSSSAKLRYSTVSALGNVLHHVNVLNENLKLKLHKELRKMVTSVRILHIDGTMKFSLEEGSACGNSWRICISEKEHSSMPVNCIKDSTLHVSGTQCGSSDHKWTPPPYQQRRVSGGFVYLKQCWCIYVWQF